MMRANSASNVKTTANIDGNKTAFVIKDVRNNEVTTIHALSLQKKFYPSNTTSHSVRQGMQPIIAR